MAIDHRNRKFVNDIGIYAIGNLGSKLITFLLVPFYTYFITDPADFGYYDLCLTAVFCLLPFITLQLNDGGFRFLIETDDVQRQKSIISYVFTSLARNSIIVAVIAVVAYLFTDIRYFGYIIIYGILQGVYEVAVQLVRGLNHTKVFVTCGVLSAFLTGIFSVILIALADLGVSGIFIANILAKIGVLIYIECKTGIIQRYFRLTYLSTDINRQLLKYCLPLLPTTACWWILNANNKFFIEHYLGLEENGLYAVAFKFTTILHVLVFIFYQAWQENAIRQYHSPDRDAFFSKVFNCYVYLLAFLSIIVPFGVRINYFWLVSPEYQSSSQYLFLLNLPILLYSLAMFFELGYQCSKRTARAFPSILIATVINIAANYYFIQWFQIYGIIWASALSNAVILIYRIIDTRKFMHISINRFSVLGIFMLIAGAILFILPSSQLLDIFILIAFTTLFIALSPSLIRDKLKEIAHRQH